MSEPGLRRGVTGAADVSGGWCMCPLLCKACRSAPDAARARAAALEGLPAAELPGAALPGGLPSSQPRPPETLPARRTLRDASWLRVAAAVDGRLPHVGAVVPLQPRLQPGRQGAAAGCTTDAGGKAASAACVHQPPPSSTLLPLPACIPQHPHSPIQQPHGGGGGVGGMPPRSHITATTSHATAARQDPAAHLAKRKVAPEGGDCGGAAGGQVVEVIQVPQHHCAVGHRPHNPSLALAVLKGDVDACGGHGMAGSVFFACSGDACGGVAGDGSWWWWARCAGGLLG